MGIAEAYLLFMLSVGLWACYELMRPTLRYLASIDKQDDVLYRNQITAYVTQFCIAAVFAPIFVVIVLVPRLSNATVLAMANRDD